MNFLPEPFFFSTNNGEAGPRVFGVWRGGQTASRVWVLCPPFAEEEKSARRALTEIALALAARGEASLLFSFRGTGDSEGNFADATLEAWRDDLGAACREAKIRAPKAELGLLGVRLGAALALQSAQATGAARLVLIEPILSGRSFLMQMSVRKKLRAQLTQNAAPTALAQQPTPDAQNAIEDLDGWPLGAALREGLNALDLRRETPVFEAKTTLFQVGPRAEIAPPLQAFAQSLNAAAHAVVMPAFWNLLDYAPATPLIEKLLETAL